MARSRVFAWILLVVVFFGAIAPTLTWLEFSSGLENLNVATALELRRDHTGSWLIPTLEGEQRIKKPPLAAWVTAASIRPRTVGAMSAPAERARDAAVTRLAWEARWPALLAACLMLVAVYELGRALGDARVGLSSAIVCGTSLMFLRFSRYALTDVYLGLFVVAGNACLARALFCGQKWIGMIGAGAALGLAVMSKGPVALAQSVLPVSLFLLTTALISRADGAKPQAGGGWVGPVLLGTIVFLAVALPWPIAVISQIPDGWRVWWKDISRDDVGERPSKFYVYLGILVWMLPWTVMLIGGAVSAVVHATRGRTRMLLSLTLMVVPLLIMTFVPDRKERYMYPVIGAAAVLAGHGLVELFDKRAAWTKWDKAGVVQHWAILAVIAVAGPQAPAWFSKQHVPTEVAIAVGAGGTVAILAGILIRQQPAGLLAASAVVMLSVAAIVLRSYSYTEKGHSDMRPLAQAIWRAAPDAVMYNAHPRGKRVGTDLSIYMNRVTTRITMEQWAQLKPAQRPLVTVTIHDKGRPPPQPPPGWKLIEEVPRDDDTWMAFVLEAQGN
jgi:4-amino-4-deoxy-L-arabinose transferase-like glycosyltransferase